jgi:hypothetical protein
LEIQIQEEVSITFTNQKKLGLISAESSLEHKDTTFITDESTFPLGKPRLNNLYSMGSSSNLLLAAAADDSSFVATSSTTCGFKASDLHHKKKHDGFCIRDYAKKSDNLNG